MVNNTTDINKTSNYLWPQIIEYIDKNHGIMTWEMHLINRFINLRMCVPSPCQGLMHLINRSTFTCVCLPHECTFTCVYLPHVCTFTCVYLPHVCTFTCVYLPHARVWITNVICRCSFKYVPLFDVRWLLILVELFTITVYTYINIYIYKWDIILSRWPIT